MARKPASAARAKAVPAAPDPRHRWDRPIQAPGHMQVSGSAPLTSRDKS